MVELKEELKEWDQCLSMLGDARVDDDGNVSDIKDSNVMYLDRDCEDREINVSSFFFKVVIALTSTDLFVIGRIYKVHGLYGCN